MVFGNMAKAYQQFRDACTKARKEDKVHGSVTKENFLVHYPSFEVILLFPLEDRSNAEILKADKRYRGPDDSKTMSVDQDHVSLAISMVMLLIISIKVASSVEIEMHCSTFFS
jgi:hypothetical protein